MYEFVYTTIPQLEAAQPLNGDELFEAVQDGKTVKVSAAQLFSTGASAYDLAVQEGFVGTRQEWLTSINGLSGESAYQAAVNAGYIGSEAEFGLSLTQAKAAGGAVFITDIRPQFVQDNVGNKQVSNDGHSLTSCATTTNFVQVHVTALTGYSSYAPIVTVNGVRVDLTAKADAPLFTGVINVDLIDEDGVMKVKAQHADGAFWETTLIKEPAASITNAVFSSDYPNGQTELKAGDLMNLGVTTDVTTVAYEVADYGAFQAVSGTLTPNTTHQIVGLLIADRGNTTRVEGFKIRVMNEAGAWSQWYDSEQSDAVLLVDVVALNNTHPNITISDIVYPQGQSAVRSGQEALIEHSVSESDSVSYTTTGLTLTDANAYEPSKRVLGGNVMYSVGVSNLTITATRSANGATRTATAAISVVNVLPQIQIRTPQARLRSGGNAGTAVQNYPITITSDQALNEAPSIDIPAGSWVDPTWTPNSDRTVWSRHIAVHDDDVKGTHTFANLSAIGLSGMVQSEIASGQNYALGGFVFRKLTVPAFPNREIDIGTSVVSFGKLRCTNLSKGAPGSFNATYKTTMDNEVSKYTTTGPSSVLNTQGNLWYNLDASNAASNTSGLLQIEIEEVV